MIQQSDRSEQRSRRRTARGIAAAVLAAGLGVLLVASLLHARPDGIGTHEQLGLPPCGLYQTTGIPCPTCGMTTAFAYAAHGRLLEAFYTQPAGAILALATAVAVLVAGYVLVTGCDLGPVWQRVWRPRIVIVAALCVFLGAWGYKIVAELCFTSGGTQQAVATSTPNVQAPAISTQTPTDQGEGRGQHASASGR